MFEKFKLAVSNPILQRAAIETAVTIVVIVTIKVISTVAANAILNAIQHSDAEPQQAE